MPHFKIEMDRGRGWEIRTQGDHADASVNYLVSILPAYAVGYPHRAYLDGKLVAEIVKPRGANSKVIVH